MPRFRLPRIPLAGRGDDTPEEEHERLVFFAQIAGFAVVIAGIAAFVLFAATNGGGSATPAHPVIPSIADAGEAVATTTTEPETLRPRPPATATAKAEVAKPLPKPATPTSAKPAPRPSSSAPATQPGGGEVTGDPWGPCSPEGARAVSPRFHLPMVCDDGRWRVLSGPGRPGGHDGDHDDDDDHGHGGR